MDGRAAAPRADGVDEHVNAAEALDGGADGGCDGGLVGEIDAAEQQVIGRHDEIGILAVQPIGEAIDEDGVRAGALEGAGGGGAEVAGGAGDDDHALREGSHGGRLRDRADNDYFSAAADFSARFFGAAKGVVVSSPARGWSSFATRPVQPV